MSRDVWVSLADAFAKFAQDKWPDPTKPEAEGSVMHEAVVIRVRGETEVELQTRATRFPGWPLYRVQKQCPECEQRWRGFSWTPQYEGDPLRSAVCEACIAEWRLGKLRDEKEAAVKVVRLKAPRTSAA